MQSQSAPTKQPPAKPPAGSLSPAATLAHYQRQLELAQAQAEGRRRSER